MKNKLIKGLFGLGLGLSAFALTTGVYAQVGAGDAINGGFELGTIGDNNVNVVVGEIDTPVYNVQISWTSMQYNYKYNEETHIYEWVVTNSCKRLYSDSGQDGYVVTVEDKQNAESLYDDASCTIEYTGNVEEEIVNEEVYEKITGGKIVITDASTLGYVIPSITWTSGEGYETVDANIYLGRPSVTYDVGAEVVVESDGMYYDYSLIGENGINNVQLPYEYNINNKYYLKLTLFNKGYGDTTTSPVVPTTGDQIGQVTVSLMAGR